MLCSYQGLSWVSRVFQGHSLLAFELWCWRRLLRVPWTARRSNQSILKEISPEYSLEGLLLSWSSNTLATWCKELSHWKRPWCWERLKVGGEEDDRGWDGWMTSPTQWTWVWASSRSWWWTGKPGVLQSMGLQRVGHDWVIELNWTPYWLFGAGEWRQGHSNSQLSRLPRVFWKGNFVGVGSLVLYPLSLLVAVSCNWQCVLFIWESFELNALAINSIMSGIYTVVFYLSLTTSFCLNNKAF